MAIARPRTPVHTRTENDRSATPSRGRDTPTGIPGPSPTHGQGQSTSPNARSTTPGRNKDSPTGIPRYFRSTQSYMIQLEEKGVIKPGTDPDEVVPMRTVTPGRRQSTGDAFADILRIGSPPKPPPVAVKPLEPASSLTRPTASSNSKVNSATKTPDKDPKSRATTPGRKNSVDSTLSLEHSLAISNITDDNTPTPPQNIRRASTGSTSAGSPSGKSKKHSPIGSPLESASSLYGVPGFLKPTKARLSQIKEREDSIGQVKPEDDPWWSARGGKVVECKSKIKDVVEKKLSHVSSKLHSATASRTSQMREKAVIERPGSCLNPVPKLSSPDAINPHKFVSSRLHQPTQAVRNGEWKPKEDKNPLTELLAKKPRQVPSRLLQAPAHTQTTKYYKTADPNDVGSGWVKILPAGSSTRALVAPFAQIRPLAGENLTNRWLEQAYYEGNIEYDEDGNIINVPDEGDLESDVDEDGNRIVRRRIVDTNNSGAIAIEDLFDDEHGQEHAGDAVERLPEPPAKSNERNIRSNGGAPPIPPS